MGRRGGRGVKTAALCLALAVLGVLILLFFFKGDTRRFGAKPVVDNPATGFAPQADNPEACAGEALVYVNLYWRDWEPSEGVYAWESIAQENHFDEWRAQGKHLVLRFVCDKPDAQAHRDIPDWLYEQTGDGVAYAMEYGKGYAPDYTNLVFIAAHARAIAALGERVSRDSFCLYVELGSLGHWGEWHVKSDEGLPPIPDAAVCAEYVTPYVNAFTTAKLLMRRPFSCTKTYGMGVYNDMAGDPDDTNEWLDWIESGGEYTQPVVPQPLAAQPEIWNTAPVGGEFTSGIPMETLLGEELPRTLSLLERSHMSFIGPKCPHVASSPDPAAVRAVKRTLGYQYRVKTAQRRGSTYTLTWVNDGAAPLYWDWPVVLCALDANGAVLASEPVGLALSTLAPGTTIRTKTVLPVVEGARAVAVGIVDPMTGVPAAALSMESSTVGKLSILYGM